MISVSSLLQSPSKQASKPEPMTPNLYTTDGIASPVKDDAPRSASLSILVEPGSMQASCYQPTPNREQPSKPTLIDFLGDGHDAKDAPSHEDAWPFRPSNGQSSMGERLSALSAKGISCSICLHVKYVSACKDCGNNLLPPGRPAGRPKSCSDCGTSNSCARCVHTDQ